MSFNSPEGNLEVAFLSDYDKLDKFNANNTLWTWGYNVNGQLLN